MTSRSVHRAAGFVAVLLAAAALCASAADWPIYRGPEHNGISAETAWFAPGAKLSVAWSQKVGTGCSSMTVVGERLFTMGNIEKSKDVVYCFNAADGKLVWKFAYDCPLSPKMYEGGPNATPTVADGKVYTLSKQGDVFCLDAATGEKVWSVRLGAKAPTWGYASSLLVLGKRVLLNAGDAGTALDKDTGKVLWSSGEGPGGYSTPVPYEQGGQTLIALFSRRSAVAVQADDGKKVWEHEWKTSYDVNAADPVLIDGGKKVFISSGYNSGCMLLNVSGGSATEAWRNKNMRNKHTNSVVQDGAIFGFDESVLTCLDLATGEKKWTQSGLGSGALVLADGKLVLLAEKGKVVVAEASAAGFKELASVQAVTGNCWAAPTLAHGRIYARSKTGDLACVTIEK